MYIQARRIARLQPIGNKSVIQLRAVPKAAHAACGAECGLDQA